MAKQGPISPAEVSQQKRETIPQAVFDVFNQLIAENLSGGYASIQQDEVVRVLVERGLNESEIYRRGWLDVEPLYEEMGWSVGYDKPGYCESYPATFTFRVKQK